MTTFEKADRPRADGVPAGPSATPTTLPSPVRASDAEREETVARLHHALGEGRLDLAETEERVAAAYAAQYRSEFASLLADLPHGGHAARTDAPGWRALWTDLVWRARILVLGSEPGGGRPTSAQCRTAAVLTALAAIWFLLWTFVGAGLVGA
jgi:hypothetical protein